MNDFVFWTAIGFSLGIVFASFFEWTLHRYLMHRAFGKFDYAFQAHAVIHHQTFKADHTYHLLDEKGPDHNKCFKVAAQIGRSRFQGAWGRNKKEAEQRAARNALSELNSEPVPFPSD